MNFELTDVQREIQRMCREFAAKELIPNARKWDETHAWPTDAVKKLAELSLLGVAVPEQYGGAGLDNVCYAIAMEEISRGCASTGVIMSVNNSLYLDPVMKFGTEEQKQQFGVPFARGEKLGCFGLTEPDNGSDPAGLKTRAVRQGDDYLISGQKIFITNGTWADVCLVFARTGGEGPKGISAFLVPTDSPGFERREIHGKLGLRGQATAEIFLDNVRVPASARLGEEGQGFSIAMASLDKGRVSVGAGCTGIIQACLEALVDYSTERTQFGRKIASYQLVQEMIAEMSVDADAARLLTWRAADLIERGEPFGVAASKAKLFASEAAVKAANLAISGFGGYGYVDEYPVQKFMRDARVMTLYEGTTQIQKLLIGRAETGVSAFL